MSNFLSQPLLKKIQNAPFIFFFRYLMYINVRRFFNHPEFLGLARGGEKLAGLIQSGMPVFRAGDEKFRDFDRPNAINRPQFRFPDSRS
jgi:hypothetical protein